MIHSSSGGGIGRLIREAMPVFTVFAATLLNLLSVPIPVFDAVAPAFALIVAYCWAVWRPQLLPMSAAFAIGLFEDLVRGTPFGVGPFALLAVVGYARYQQTTLRGAGFGILWFGFAGAGFAAACANWAALSFAYRTLLSPWPGLVQYCVTLAAFPIVAWLLMRFDQQLAPQN